LQDRRGKPFFGRKEKRQEKAVFRRDDLSAIIVYRLETFHPSLQQVNRGTRGCIRVATHFCILP